MYHPIENEHENNEHEQPVNDPTSLMNGKSFDLLNRAVGQLIDDFSLVSFLKLDVQSEDSVSAVLSYIDDAIQFNESQEVNEPSEVDLG